MDSMNINFSISTAVELVKVNIENAGRFVTASEVVEFMEDVYIFLRQSGEEDTPKE